jgi:archaemetzincin
VVDVGENANVADALGVPHQEGNVDGLPFHFFFLFRNFLASSGDRLAALGVSPSGSVLFSTYYGKARNRPALSTISPLLLSPEFQNRLPAKAPPRPGDWLAEHAERGQTFLEFAQSPANVFGEGRRDRLVLASVEIGRLGGAVPEDALAAIVEVVQAFVGVRAVKLEAGVRLDGVAVREDRGFGVQAHAGAVLAKLRPPARAFSLTAVTMLDLFPRDGWEFCFGLADVRSRAGVFSFARFGGLEDPLFLQRACKVATHEVLHTFGLRHCVLFECLMNGSNSLEESDRKPFGLCSVCLRKLHWATACDLHQRDSDLAALQEKHGLKFD